MSEYMGYTSSRLSPQRQMVIASASVTSKTNTFHCFTETDISLPRSLMQAHFNSTGEKLSLTAYVIKCLALTIEAFPEFNSFIKGRKHLIMKDITISTMVEREINGEKVPEPLVVKSTQNKSYSAIHAEIRIAQSKKSGQLGELSGGEWIRYIPYFLLKSFVKLASKNVGMAQKYGKIAVTSAGMFSREAVWFIPHGSATVLVTIGSLFKKAVLVEGEVVEKEHLCLTVSFDHDIIDGAPASRFMEKFTAELKSGKILKII